MTDADLAPFASIDVGAAYRELRERVLALVAGLPNETWEQPVPHCPAWTVRQTLAHLAGVVDDGINGNMTGVATDAWTKTQVDKRADLTGPAIAEEWATYAPFVEARATEVGLALAQLVFDAVTHEHDLRHALRQPGARDSSALRVGLAFVVRMHGQRPGGAPIQVVVDGQPLFSEPQAGAPTLTASTFDVIRSMSSRRSREQVQSLAWIGDPTPVLDGLAPFGYPSTSIVE